MNGIEFYSQELNDVRTTESNPFRLHFDMDSQLKVIMDNLFDMPLICNYKSALWLSEVCRSIKQIISIKIDERCMKEISYLSFLKKKMKRKFKSYTTSIFLKVISLIINKIK